MRRPSSDQLGPRGLCRVKFPPTSIRTRRLAVSLFAMSGPLGSMDHANSVDVSVIVASVESARALDRCIDSIQVALQGMHSELLIVDASRDPSAEIAERKLGSG